MKKLDVLIKEYETLRAESLDSIKNRTNILAFGIAAIGIVSTVFASEALKFSSAVALVFNVFIPSISIIVLAVWLGEFERMMRAGDHLKKIERSINNQLNVLEHSDDVLTWETGLRNHKKQIKYPYIVVILSFGGISLFSLLYGRVHMNEYNLPYGNFYRLTFLVVSIGVVVALYLIVRHAFALKRL